MTERELRRLGRKELLELLILRTQECEELRKQLDEAEAALQERRLMLSRAGSIADAALQINAVFDVAQKAAQQYLDNVRWLCERKAAEAAREEHE